MTNDPNNQQTETKQNNEFPQNLFEKVTKTVAVPTIVRPSLSYWQDAIYRFKKNKQSLFAFSLVILLLLFTFVGPFLWTINPAFQDLDNASASPNLGVSAVVMESGNIFEPKILDANEVAAVPLIENVSELGEVKDFQVDGVATTQKVILSWSFLPGAAGYTIYRSDVKPNGDSMGVPLGDVTEPGQISFEDNQTLEAREYFYSIVPKSSLGEEGKNPVTLNVKVLTAINLEAAQKIQDNIKVGERLKLSSAPLGTDSLGRDILARLMDGGRVSLVIGIVSSLFTVLFGILFGGIAGYFGGTIDIILMRFTDLISGLPFLLCMILLKVILNVGPGESGITAMLISLVLLSWTGSARLVRGQVLQLRNSEFIQAARLMGAKPTYIILRHMLPNQIGVILVTLTFLIPSAIFTEAFLSFVGLGVASPACSWGSLCNEGIQSLLTRPYEFFAPAIVISLTVLAFNLLGDGLRDALDPKLRSNE